MNITFDNVDLSQFIKIVSVNRGILPERENSRYDIPKSSGSHYSRYRYKEKIIPVEFIIINSNLNAVRRALAGMLDVAAPAKLVFGDEPTFYWMAVPDGAIDLAETLTLGRGAINFLCPQPWAFSTTVKELSLAPASKIITTVNNGTAPTYPKYKINFSADCGFLGIASPDGIIQLGNKLSVDTVPVPNSEKLIETTFSGTGKSSWSTNINSPIHVNAQSNGTLAEDANGVRPATYGTWLANKQWHGPTLNKPLATDTLGVNTADNWELYSEFHFRTLDSNALSALAMMEFGVLDASSTKLAVIRLDDTLDIASEVNASFYVGANLDANGREQAQLWNGEGYDYFNGSICITKMGNNFNFEIYNSTTGKVLNKTFYSEAIGALKAKSAYVFMGKLKDAPAYNDMSVTYLKLTKHHTETVQDIPNIFSNGDELIIDNEAGIVTLNGKPYLETLDIGSKFFPVNPGSTGIGVVYSSWASQPSVIETFTERYY